MFSKQDLKRLIIPLVFEQLLVVAIGMADTIMVSSVGEAAVSGIALVDSINMLLIGIFTAIATGGAIVAAQYLGRQDGENARLVAKQLIWLALGLSTAIAIFSLAFRPTILRVIFGKVDSGVMQNAMDYFFWSAMSYPFLALYNSGASLFRAMGNSKISLVTSLAMNATNICGNALLIFGFGMGVKGAAIASLVARALGAFVVLGLLRSSHGPIRLDDFKPCYSPDIIKNILRIGIPGGIETSMFQVGKILVQGFVASLGTVAIAANAVAMNMVSIAQIPGNAIATALMTVVGQCVGAGMYEEAKAYVMQLMKSTYVMLIAMNVSSFFVATALVGVFGLSPETTEMAAMLVRSYNIASCIFWAPSFFLPSGLRAAGDAKFVLSVSGFSMWACRIFCSYLFVSVFQVGIIGIWIAMYLDWVFRGLCYSLRFRGNKWKSHAIL